MPDKLPVLRDYGTRDAPPEASPSAAPQITRLTVIGWLALASCGAVLVSVVGTWATALGLVSIDGTHGDIPTVAVAALIAAGGFAVAARASSSGLLFALGGGLWAAYITVYEYDHITHASPLVSVGWGLYLCGLGAIGIISIVAVVAMEKQRLTR